MAYFPSAAHLNSSTSVTEGGGPQVCEMMPRQECIALLTAEVEAATRALGRYAPTAFPIDQFPNSPSRGTTPCSLLKLQTYHTSVPPLDSASFCYLAALEVMPQSCEVIDVIDVRKPRVKELYDCIFRSFGPALGQCRCQSLTLTSMLVRHIRLSHRLTNADLIRILY